MCAPYQIPVLVLFDMISLSVFKFASSVAAGRFLGPCLAGMRFSQQGTEIAMLKTNVTMDIITAMGCKLAGDHRNVAAIRTQYKLEPSRR